MRFGNKNCGKGPRLPILERQSWGIGMSSLKNKEIANEKDEKGALVDYYGAFDAHRLGGR